MDVATNILSAILGGAAAMGVAVLNSYWSRKREYEADWRKVKLNLYTDFTRAVSGMVEGRANESSKAAYLDAAHSLMLVTAPEVLRKLNDLNRNKLDKKFLTPLFVAIRNDIKLRKDNSDFGLEFQLFKFDPDQPE